MRVLYVILIIGVVACSAAPGASEEDGKLELFSGVAIEKDKNGEDKLNVKFEPGELKDMARTFQEARGKIKKYSPLISSLSTKIIAVAGIVFGVLTLLVTKAFVVAKLAFLAATALGIQKLLSSGSLNGLSGKVSQFSNFQSPQPQWSSPSAAGSSISSYPYARSSSLQDGNDLAYKAHIE